MPDVNGMPTAAEVARKVAISAPSPVPDPLAADVAAVLAEVIARIQSPAQYDGSGGTGRQFVPVTETRYFDGSGYPELIADDIVPGTPLTVSSYGTPYPDVVLRAPAPGKGWNVLALPYGGFSGGLSGWGQTGFPRGVGNVAVTATWGFAATVPADVCEAVRCEAAHRLLIGGFVSLAGVGETVKIGDFEINTSAGVSVWAQSSPIAMLHQTYLDCVRRYEVPTARAFKRLAQRNRMS